MTASSPLYLLRVEGQNLDGVIFDTHDLSTMAGGSQLLAQAPVEVKELLGSLKTSGLVKAVRTIQCAASIGLFALCADRKNISAILEQIKEKLALDPFCHLTIHAGAIAVPDHSSTPESNGEYNISDNVLENIDLGKLRHLEAHARLSQMRAPKFTIPVIAPDANTACDMDLVGPARRNKPGSLALSESVKARRGRGKRFRWAAGPDGDTAAVRTFEEMTTYETGGGIRTNGRWNGRLAVISIDGRHFGQIRSALCKYVSDLEWFTSELVKRQDEFRKKLAESWVKKNGDTDFARYMFLYSPPVASTGAKPDEAQRIERLRQIYGDYEEPRLRLQRVITAGDDAVYLMPAWLAWEFLRIFFKSEWKLSPNTKGQEKALVECQEKGLVSNGALTFRAGVVICHAKAPIHPIRELAHKLESDVAAEDGKTLVNPIAYEVLKSFDFVGAGLNEYRERKRACLEPHEALIDGQEIANLECRLRELKEKASSGEIKTPLRWHETLARLNDPNFQKGDLYHLSQWRDYIF
jgi:hypothetical protein